ncbi:hypothetical protein [Planomonospora venezuelensis]|uniref:Uncharacterized protein n=1 Tax=Planomonospora venezuelensis TaxID=1999 RepID=A0A841D1H1_PLAVE|nr:hypothetical protein [Planomonospora venezuelensis]MBB5962354.1 hypothetical protein [Planomonospora venezuelensis]GIN00735.1 hypothetical protein Pve01_23930 [Planomonospora venezuelensis]
MTKIRAAGAVLTACLMAACTPGRTAAPGPSPAPERTTVSGSSPAPGRTATPGAAASPRATGRVAAAPEWKAAPVPELEGSAALVDVAVAGPEDVWAVGYQASAEDREGSPAVVRWDGARWRETPVQGHGLHHVEGVSASGPDDVWIVGNGEVPVAVRWDGRRWAGERPFGVARDYRLTDVAATGDRTWFTATGPSETVVLERRGGEFRNFFQTAGTFAAVTARGEHVWAVGHDGSGPLAWHGTTGGLWETMETPRIPGGRLNRVWAVSPSDVWAVGEIATGPEDVYGNREAEPLVLHWDGSGWRRSQVPVARGSLHGLTAFGAGDVWASGVDADHSGQPLLLHFDGTRWSARYGPLLRAREEDQQYEVSDDVGRTGITRVPGTGTVWVVGSVGWGDNESGFVLRR